MNSAAFSAPASRGSDRSDPFRFALDMVPGLLWSAQPSGYVDFVNRRWCDYTGLDFANSCGWGWQVAIHPEDRTKLNDYWLAVLATGASATGAPGAFEARLRRHDGRFRWFLFRAMPDVDAGKLIKWYGETTDIHERKQFELLLEGEAALLELVARGTPTEQILAALCELVEACTEDCRCGVALLDAAAARISETAGPSLPEAYRKALAGRPLDMDTGPCSEAALSKAEIVCSDIAQDPRWHGSPWQALALRHGIRACWSTPILSSAGNPLGAIALYWSESHIPAPRSRQMVDRLSQLAALAIERSHTLAALHESERRFSLAVAGSTDGIWDWDLTTDLMFQSERTQALHGLAPGPTVRPRSEWRGLWKLHPADVEYQSRCVEGCLAGRTPVYEGEWRVLHPDGIYRWVHERGMCLRDETGQPIRIAGSSSDIDARKRAEEALRHSEERYAVAVAGADVGIFDWDLISDRVYLSDRAVQLLHLPRGRNGLKRKEWLGMLQPHPEDAGPARSALRAHLAGQTAAYEAEARLLFAEGGCRWYRQRGVALRAGNGRPYRMAGSIEDVTERMVAAAELRLHKEELQQVIDASSDFIRSIEFDPDRRFVRHFYSPAVATLSGLPRDRFVADMNLWRTLVHPQDRPALAAALERVLTGARDSEEQEYRITRVDGALRWVRDSVRATRLPDGGIVLNGVISDITERKRIEEELRARQDMLDLAQSAAHAVAFEWSINGAMGTNRWTPQLEIMYGLKPGTYDGSYEAWKKLVHPEDWPAVKQAIRQANATGNVAAEYRVVHLDGSVHWLQAKGRMFFDADGSPSRMVGFMLDVTERHQAEDELRRLERQLRQAQRLESMGTLAGGIAHDFNNILGAILGYGEMALRGAARGTRLRRDLESIMVAGERGRSLVERILAFSRSSIGERIPVQMQAVVREGLSLLAATAPIGIVIRSALLTGKAAVLADATQIHQVLMNLLTNAVHAMGSAGTLNVRLTIEQVEVRRVITTGALAAGEYVVLEVADTGTGITPETLERIFDPFFTSKEVGVGTGLGLSLVHGIASALGGAVNVTTVLGAGSTFRVYLPRSGDADDVTNSDAGDAEIRFPLGSQERILVVDDEEPLLRLVTETLSDLHYAVRPFSSSSAALAAFRDDPQAFDAAITDERMPGINGTSLTRSLLELRPGLPVLLITGYAGTSVVRRARAAGAAEVLKKPLAARALAQALARALQPR